MSHSNEKLAEELLIRAFQMGIYDQVMERASKLIHHGERRSVAIDRAIREISGNDEIHGTGHPGSSEA